MAEPRKPADHKPAKGTLFTFTGKDGKSHMLPLASAGAEKLSGRVMRDAFMDGTEGELRLGFTLLEVCGASQVIVDALYDLPALETMKILADWMNFGDGLGTPVPQSSGSSA